MKWEVVNVYIEPRGLVIAVKVYYQQHTFFKVYDNKSNFKEYNTHC